MKINFENAGQNFTWWEVDEEDVITACDSPSPHEWIGCVIIWPGIIESGDTVEILKLSGEEYEVVPVVKSVEL